MEELGVPVAHEGQDADEHGDAHPGDGLEEALEVALIVRERKDARGQHVQEIAEQLREIVDRETLLAMQRAIESVHVAATIQEYCVDVVGATRESASTAVGASPRGSLALLKLARVRAALDGRDFVLPDDVKAVGVPALAHRLVLRPELWVQRVSAEDVVREVLDTVPTPPAEDVAAAPRT